MKHILLKLSGELFSHNLDARERVNKHFVESLADQIKQLSSSHKFDIVIGGGNFFRGSREGQKLGLRRTTADAVGMLATAMNGLILNDVFQTHGLESVVLGSYPITGYVESITQQALDSAKHLNKIIIFVGGTGSPFYSTDTAAVTRALHVGCNIVWKATNVDYVYNDDPKKNQFAQALKQITYNEVLSQKLRVMDSTAIALAQEYNVTLRVFSVFEKDALLRAAHEKEFGSTITT